MRTVIPERARLVPAQAKRVFKGVIYDVYQWPQKLFDGSEETFEMLKRPDTVKVIAIRGNKIVILYQEQPTMTPFYDIPGGMHDHENESELEATQRELLEEAGMTFKSWRLLECFQPHSKIDQFVYIFLATDFERATDPTPDPGEKIEVRLMTFDEVKALIDDRRSRYLPKDIFEKVNSIEELINLPSFKGQTARES